MEEFKRELKKRISYLRWFIAAIALVGAYDYFMIRNTGEKTIEQKVAIGFQIGILVGVGILACIYLIKLSSVIWDEEKIQVLYTRENNEKAKVFREKSGMPTTLMISMGMVLIGAIAAYFSILVFYTLVVAAVIQILIIIAVYFYYKRK